MSGNLEICLKFTAVKSNLTSVDITSLGGKTFKEYGRESGNISFYQSVASQMSMGEQ